MKGKDSSGQKKRAPRKKLSWQERILKIVDTIELDFSDVLPSLSDEQFAVPYVANAWREILAAASPTIKIGPDLFESPRKLGGMLGHKFSAFQAFGGEWKPSNTIRHIAATKDFIDGLQEAENAAPDMQAEVVKAVQRCLKIALEQSPAVTRDFFSGFTEALKVGTVTKFGTFTGVSSTTFLHILIVILGTRTTEIFQSIPHFHKTLELIYGRQVAGSLERIEKVCHRLQLSFRGPGRPELIRTNKKNRRPG